MEELKLTEKLETNQPSEAISTPAINKDGEMKTEELSETIKTYMKEGETVIQALERAINELQCKKKEEVKPEEKMGNPKEEEEEIEDKSVKMSKEFMRKVEELTKKIETKENTIEKLAKRVEELEKPIKKTKEEVAVTEPSKYVMEKTGTGMTLANPTA